MSNRFLCMQKADSPGREIRVDYRRIALIEEIPASGSEPVSTRLMIEKSNGDPFYVRVAESAGAVERMIERAEFYDDPSAAEARASAELERVKKQANQLAARIYVWSESEHRKRDILKKVLGDAPLSPALREQIIKELAVGDIPTGEVVWQNECQLVWSDYPQDFEITGDMGLTYDASVEDRPAGEIRVAIRSIDATEEHPLVKRLRDVPVRVTVEIVEGGNK